MGFYIYFILCHIYIKTGMANDCWALYSWFKGLNHDFIYIIKIIKKVSE